MTLVKRVLAFLRRPWAPARTPSADTLELKRKLAVVERDDAKVSDLNRRSERIMQDNHLVADVRIALGIRP